MNEMKYTEIPNAEKADIGKICLVEPGCNPLCIEVDMAACLRTCLDCGMTTLDEDGEPRPMTLADCKAIAYVVTE